MNQDFLALLVRERQAEMRREAQTEYALRGPTRSGRGAQRLRRLIVALCVIAPIALLLVRVAAAASAGGSGGGFIHLMM
jgi:hypothetical protein